MNALIILAHGSRRKESNIEIKELAEKVRILAEDEYDLINYAYLEVVEPDLIQSIDNTIKSGAKSITVHPYFLNSGNHVTRDIPAMIETVKEKYPYCKFKVSSCIGMSDEMPALILERARSN
jgi:sirohydrochlorin ferrochelatase